MLQQLGMRHVGYGLKPEYWKVAEKVLVEVLKEGLGNDFTKEVEMAWLMVYGFMTATMLAGFEAAKAAQSSAQLSLPSTTNGSGSITPCSFSMASPKSAGEKQHWDKEDLDLLQAATSPVDQLPSLLHSLQRSEK